MVDGSSLSVPGMGRGYGSVAQPLFGMQKAPSLILDVSS